LTLYASVGRALSYYEADPKEGTLVKRGSIDLPANVQYAWPHASRRFLYVASSDGGPGLSGTRHHASTLHVEAASGAITFRGDPVALPSRPIHITTDIPSAYALIAYNNPSGLTVHAIRSDSTLGEAVKQLEPLDAGIYAHQIRVAPSNRFAILVTRGNDAEGNKREDPGALKVFRFKDGQLTGGVSIAPGGGYGFGPRHLDFHPTKPWIYVSRERENKLDLFTFDDQNVVPTPRTSITTLAEPTRIRPRQVAGTVHVHPNGRVVYVANRANATIEVAGQRVFAGGENNIAVFAIDRATGEPKPIQHADSHGFHPRTFHIDPSGRMLVAAHILPQVVRDGSTLRTVPPCLSVFRIGGDGRLEYVRRYDVEVGGDSMFWMGMVAR
jgi:6-phosphogluconolactonase (cycloisomerase 2 family)